MRRRDSFDEMLNFHVWVARKSKDWAWRHRFIYGVTPQKARKKRRTK
jgi:hypothetical protein